jgi:hypothetical protein
VFQYFIGNTDWSALAGPSGGQCCHNIVPYTGADGVLVPVPYDFDSSGIVDPPYALPDGRLPIRSVRQRLYRGRCRELAELGPVFELFAAKRTEITQLFVPAAGLSEDSAKRAKGYIDGFYDVLGNPEELEKRFRNGCDR